MRRRFSIAELMVIILLAAVDARSARSIVRQEGGNIEALLTTGAVPMLNLLGVGFLVLRRKARRGEPAAFLRGFEAGGALALAAFVAAAITFPEALTAHFLATFRPIIRWTAASRIGRTGLFVLVVELAAMAYFTALLTVPALLSGWFAGRRARIVSRIGTSPGDRPAEDRPEPTITDLRRRFRPA